MEIYVARQPIFNKYQEVFAYELLYRSGANKFYSSLNGDQASSEVITNSFLLIGLETLTRGKKAFINFTKNLLENDVATLLPNDTIVVEILQDIEPDENTLNACKKLKELGYLLALSDFCYNEKFLPLVELVDIIKINFLTTKKEEREAVVQRIGRERVNFLAEKVETMDEYIQAMKFGYSYFQGYFFSRPHILTGKDIPSFKIIYLKILQEINKPELDFDRLEEYIKMDVSLSYKLLKFINSLSFGFRNEIRSIKQALVLLGQKELSKWLSLIALKGIGDNKPDELIITAICRARFCELIAPRVGLKDRSSDLFLMGMFSLIDAFLDRPMADILPELPISNDIKHALLGGQSRFRDVYELITSYESGNWEQLARQALKLELEEKEVRECYLNSLYMSNKIFIKNVS
ncbi:MAG TPA: HDOD domain-containing protein [Firmicutes bacterium]|jgi:c-di-GMP-related signal transduction protein|nr:HDOD domain-containing protein [Bacillota bacterium]